MVIVKTMKLDNLPDAEKFNGTIIATAIFYDINPVLILEEHPNNTGPELNLAIDYYAPAAAARLGLVVDKTQYIVKTKGILDYDYKDVILPGLIKDPWGTYHAGNGDVRWVNIELNRLSLILSDAKEETSRHLGKTGVFVKQNGEVIREKIKNYDGTHYYNSKNEAVFAELLRLEN